MTEIWTNIPDSARIFLGIWLLLLVLTLFLFSRNHRLFPVALGLSVFSLASAFALFTPYLNRWDEQFHALVGKNLASDPFHPKLIDLDSSFWQTNNWANTNTWLHKQPLFLYQIALSIKMFGATVYAVRLPSIIFHVIGTFVLYDLGKIIFNRNYGLLAAMLFSVSALPLGLLTGLFSTDHNDSIFMIYVLLSFWAWFKFLTSDNKKWVKWIGIFVGCAILTKWLVGLLVFAPWSLYLAIRFLKNQTLDFKSYFKALSIALLISVPWQIYIFSRFPKEAEEEMAYNGRHFFEVIEGHSGDWSFHFLNFENLFFNGFLAICLMILFAFSIYQADKKAKKLLGFMVFSTAFVYLFFTIALTKMGSFIAPVFPFVILLMVFPVSFLLEKLKQKKIKYPLYLIFGVCGGFLLMKPTNVIADYGLHANRSGNIDLLTQQWNFFDQHVYNKPNELVINAALRGYGSVSWQFKNGTKAISNIPSKKEIESLKKAGYSIYCINWKWGEKIPNYIQNDTSIKYIQFE